MKPILFILTILTIIPIANTQNKEKSPSRDNLNKITIQQGSEFNNGETTIKAEKGNISLYIDKKREIIYIEKAPEDTFTLNIECVFPKKLTILEGKGRINLNLNTRLIYFLGVFSGGLLLTLFFLFFAFFFKTRK